MRTLICTLNAKYIHTNLAIRLLYHLNKKNHSGLAWKEFTIKEDKAEITAYCKDFDVVAFSCYIWNISPTLEVCRLLKAENPTIKILLGGPEVSYDYTDVIKRPEVDYIIAGEGEIAFSEFMATFPDISNVPNLVFLEGETVRSNPSAPLFNLNELAGIMPYSADENASLSNKVLYVETSRGCPYKCEFCLASLDNKVRYLPDASIKATLLHLMQHGRVIKFLDRTFNIKRDFTIDIFTFILAHHKPGNVFQFEITADILHPDIIRFIRERIPKGLFRFEIGIQTINQQANLAVSRKQNFDKTRNIIRQLDDIVEMHLDLIVGLPLDRIEDIKYSFEEVFKLYAPELQLGFLKFLKGTPVRDKHNEHGYVFDQEPPYQIIESNYLSREELLQITQLEHALEIYWNSGKAMNCLRYVTAKYSIYDFLQPLGQRFGEEHSYHAYSFNDVFDVLHSHVKTIYPDDAVLLQLVALDYYLHFKVRPQLRYLENSEEAKKLPQSGSYKEKGVRHLQLPITFDYATFKKENRIINTNSSLLLRYDGLNKAQVVQAEN